MQKVTYKNLYSLIEDQINRKVNFNTVSPYSEQISRISVSPLTGNSRSDAFTAELISAVQTLLSEALQSWIIRGLEVSETDPISSSVIIQGGKGTVGGNIYELTETTLITIPFDSDSSVFFIVLYNNNILIEKTYDSKKLTIAKIVVLKPGVTNLIQNDKDSSWNAYIVNFKEFKLYGYNDKFEEDTIELLRDNISPILADNLIGNIRLSEDLKIINTQGTIELNSESLKIYDTDKNNLAKFNRNGIYFYNTNGIETARFTNIDSRIGNMLITTSTIQSENFVSGALGAGFRIEDNGDAEFNNIKARGKLTSTVFEKDVISVIGGNLLVMDGDILSENMSELDSSNLIISGDTSFSVGDILRIKDGIDDEWFEVTNISLAPIYTVTRDKANAYTSNNNPAWKKGTSVVNYKQSGDGGIFLTSSEATSPYMSIITHAGSPWSTLTTHLKIGNLNGFLGYNTDLYGIGIGTTNSYLKYDPIDGLQIKGSITITGGNASVTYYQNLPPGSTGDTNVPKNGDYWVDTNDSNKLYIFQDDEWISISSGNSAWEHPLDTTKIDGGQIYTGSVTATQITVNSLSALSANLGTITAGTVTGATLQTATSGARVVMTDSGLVAYDSNENIVFLVDLEGPSNALSDVGDVIFGGTNNYLKWDASQSILTLQSRPVTATGNEKITIANNKIIIYDNAGLERVIIGDIT